MRDSFMRLTTLVILIGTLVASAAAFAHSGVANPAVLQRMEAMKQIGDQMKVLGSMAKGQVAFDAGAAQAAVDAIAAQAAQVPDLFREPVTDPKSEALPSIWESYGDFTLKAEALQVAANAQISAERDLAPTVAALGAACKACHSHYKD